MPTILTRGDTPSEAARPNPHPWPKWPFEVEEPDLTWDREKNLFFKWHAAKELHWAAEDGVVFSSALEMKRVQNYTPLWASVEQRLELLAIFREYGMDAFADCKLHCICPEEITDPWCLACDPQQIAVWGEAHEEKPCECGYCHTPPPVCLSCIDAIETALGTPETNYESETAMMAPPPPLVPTTALPTAERGLRVMDLDAFLDMPEPEWLISDFLDSGFSYMTGGSNAGKTFVAIDIACRLAIGGFWYDLPIPRPIRVLYLAAEDPAGVAMRVRAWMRRYASEADRIALKERLSFTADTPSLIDPADRQRLFNTAVEHDLTIIDTQTDVTSGINENSKQEMDALLVTMKAIIDAGKSVLMIHHPNGMDDSWKPRGIGTQLGKANTVIQVRPKDKDKPTGPIIAITRKQKHAKKGKRRTFLIVDSDGGPVLEEVVKAGATDPTWTVQEAIILALCELGHEDVAKRRAREIQAAVSDHMLKHGWNPEMKSMISRPQIESALGAIKAAKDDGTWVTPIRQRAEQDEAADEDE